MVLRILYNLTAMKKRRLTFHQQIAQKNLKTLWDAKKNKLGLTQQKAAKMAGWSTQASVNQYLNGYIPLNLKATFIFARILEVSVTDIDPKIEPYLPETAAPGNYDETPAKYICLPKIKRDFIDHVLTFDKNTLETLMLVADALSYKKSS